MNNTARDAIDGFVVNYGVYDGLTLLALFAVCFCLFSFNYWLLSFLLERFVFRSNRKKREDDGDIHYTVTEFHPDLDGPRVHTLVYPRNRSTRQ